MSGRWRCTTCGHVSAWIWHDWNEKPRCRRCQYGHVIPAPDRRQVALSLLCERVSVIED